MQATTPTAEAEGMARPALAEGRAPRIAVGVVASVLLILAIGLPVWRANLSAPQYPKGLRLVAYGDRVEGDIQEITALNHYVGMRPYRADDLPEMKLWVPTIVACLVAVAVATVAGRRWPGRLARLFVWAVPFGALADVQFRLYQYGHGLDPKAALRIDEFTPLVVGRTKVLNFITWSYPGQGLVAILAAALLLTFGPGLLARLRRSSEGRPAEARAEAA